MLDIFWIINSAATAYGFCFLVFAIMSAGVSDERL